MKGWLGMLIRSDVMDDVSAEDFYSDADLLSPANWRVEPKLGVDTAGKLQLMVNDGTIDGRKRTDFLRFVSGYTKLGGHVLVNPLYVDASIDIANL